MHEFTSQHHFCRFVENNNGLRAGESIFCIAVIIVNVNTEVVISRDNLFHQDISAVFKEGIIGSIKSNVMRITPSTTHTWYRENMWKIKMRIYVAENLKTAESAIYRARLQNENAHIIWVKTSFSFFPKNVIPESIGSYIDTHIGNSIHFHQVPALVDICLHR